MYTETHRGDNVGMTHYGLQPIIATTAPPEHYIPVWALYWYNAKRDQLWERTQTWVPFSERAKARLVWKRVDLGNVSKDEYYRYMNILRPLRAKAEIMGYYKHKSNARVIRCLSENTLPQAKKASS
jgi:hypothetical protein